MKKMEKVKQMKKMK